MTVADVCRIYWALETLFPQQKTKHRDTISFLACASFGLHRVYRNTSFVLLLGASIVLLLLYVRLLTCCSFVVCRYPGKYNLYRRVVTQVDNLSTLSSEQREAKFLPIDEVAANTPQVRVPTRKRKAAIPNDSSDIA